MAGVERGFLLIADISGYTRFLTRSELEHARGILEGLFDGLLRSLDLPFHLSNVQGDAVFAFARDSDVADGQQVLDAMDAVYCGFAETQSRMVLNTTCTCAACANMTDLDLKLVVHHGEFAEQAAGERRELAGGDVILLHRLLKNTVREATGLAAYGAVTQAAADAINLPAVIARSRRHTEPTEEFGDVVLHVFDMAAVWQQKRQEAKVAVADDEPRAHPDVRLRLPVSVDWLWALITSPARRADWFPNVVKVDRMTAESGRAGIGTVDHCAHGGDAVTVMTVRAWRPNEMLTLEIALPMGGRMRLCFRFSERADGADLDLRCAAPDHANPLKRWLLRRAIRKQSPAMAADWDKAMAAIRGLAEADLAKGIGRPTARTAPPKTDIAAAIGLRLAAPA
ncbi:MAG: DUF2652 domain-containing protein [Alphaproteobacteria bacterium]